jgi:hypothetical protein
MHPPLFRKTHRLSDWPECVIELHCQHCRGGSVGYPVRLLMQRRGDMTFENLLRRLRCKRCQAVKPAPVYLVAGITGRRAVGLIQSGRLSLCRQGHELVVQIKRLVPDRRCLKRADSGPTEVAAKGKNLARSGLTPVVMGVPQPWRSRAFRTSPCPHIHRRPTGTAVVDKISGEGSLFFSH